MRQVSSRSHITILFHKHLMKVGGECHALSPKCLTHNWLHLIIGPKPGTGSFFGKLCLWGFLSFHWQRIESDIKSLVPGSHRKLLSLLFIFVMQKDGLHGYLQISSCFCFWKKLWSKRWGLDSGNLRPGENMVVDSSIGFGDGKRM